MEKSEFDLLIIGGGPAGMAAGIYGGRSLLKTAIIEKVGTGGQLNITDKIANYPGFPDEIAGYELGSKMLAHASKFGAEIIYDEVKNISKNDGWYSVQCIAETYKTKSIIIATGASYRPLGVSGEARLRGRGVSYCGTCDGAFFKDKIITVIGGGDTALEEAEYLTQFGSEAFIVHRRQGFRAAPKNIERVKNNPKISLILDTIVESIEGEDKVEKLILKNKVTAETTEHKTDAAFIFIGYIPNTDFVKDFIQLDDEGYIVSDKSMATNEAGIFVAGDVSVKEHRQVVTAVSDGAVAAMNAWKYISEHKGSGNE